MRMLFIINTPGQAHTWRYIIKSLMANGHAVNILARDYGSTPHLLDSFGFRFKTYRPVGSRTMRLLSAFNHFQQCYNLARGTDPSLIMGFGLDAAVTARRLGRPCVVLCDDEHTYIQNRLTTRLAKFFITPDTFARTLGNNHIRVKAFKELAYLHPDYFIPDISIFDELKVNRGEKFVVLRFNVLDAVHDIGMRGFSVSDRLRLVKELSAYARVFISPESGLTGELKRYFLPTAYNRIHHVLYYAQMLVSDTGTMSTEAGILGTPAVRFQTTVGRNDPRAFGELQQRYGLVYSFGEPEGAIHKAVELIKKPGLKEEWAEKRQALFKDKIDINRFMVDFIQNLDGV